ncbi:MAG TPA: cupin domain-containing protein [Candidatus Tyrphobacter sp.]
MQRRVIHATDEGWEGVAVEGYRPGAAVGVERHTILGGRKGDPSEPGPRMELRYFELQPGAVSRLEKHEHEHYVVIRRGEGYAIVGDSVSAVGPNDVVYVAPLEIHQFVNRGITPFGFYCIVDACRDFAQEPTQEDLARLNASPAGAVAKPFAVPLPVKRS